VVYNDTPTQSPGGVAMRHRSHASWKTLASTLGLLVIFSGSGRSSDSSTQKRAETAPPDAASLTAQMRDDLRKALRLNSEAATQDEWSQSGYTPSDIFQNLKDLRRPEAWDSLCQALSTLPAEDLALFQDEIENPVHGEQLSCAPDLALKLKNHWEEAQLAFAQDQMLEQMGREFSAKDEEPILLPSMEKHIDAARGPVYSRGELKDGEIAFTFDDGPHPTRTQRIMEILRNSGIRATFFELGPSAREYSAISRQLVDAGHTVASHSVTHPELPKLPVERAEKEILNGRTMVAQACGVDVPFFRFPYGARNRTLTDFVKSRGMASFFWNMDTLDWKIRNPKTLFENILSELNREKGGIILFHDVHEQTVIVLPYLIEELKARNFSTVVFVPH